MSDAIKDWVVVSSKSGMTKDGFPIGEILCRDAREVEYAIRDHKIHDPVVKPYTIEYGVSFTDDQVNCIRYSLHHTMNSLKLDQVERDLIKEVLHRLNCLRM